eukprot:CAMPEP_0182417908 /NCGR_PEP_ID=MMETSP1167-20130531/2358_1 /TAXON_ID=2988 /ORGANISM="Mallomonas Sp, Strain CCMP3275" /LENGTH=352 /DNA_ID=CAMNT_0024591767 /DNA_START=20 /DNA_END=1078 /DNA_ORIENTATION=+
MASPSNSNPLKRKLQDESMIAADSVNTVVSNGSTNDGTDTVKLLIENLRTVNFKRKLNEGADGTVVMLGYFCDDPEELKPAICKVVPKPLLFIDDTAVQNNIHSMKLELKTESGSRFTHFNGFGSEPIKYGVEIIYPATDVDIKRHTRVQMHIINESYEMYETIVKPTILDTKNIEWVYNILDGKKETDRVLYADKDAESGFMLIIDTKWRDHPDTSTSKEEWKTHPSVKNLYCQALVNNRELRSIRDLRGHHADMLENLLKKSLETIEEVYGIRRTEIRVFIHYPPQFYHMHVHFTRVGNEFGCPVEKAHMLKDVIDLLRIDGDIFTKRTLACRVAENDKLFNTLVAAAQT